MPAGSLTKPANAFAARNKKLHIRTAPQLGWTIVGSVLVPTALTVYSAFAVENLMLSTKTETLEEEKLGWKVER